MIKYFYRLMLVVFLIVGGMQAYAAKAPANAAIGTQATLTFIGTTNTQETVVSNIVTVTVNPVYSVTVAPGITSSAFAGETISFPTKITNNSNIDSAVAVYLANGDDLVNVSYTVDTNGNGVLDDGETTVLTNTTIPNVNLLGVMTPVLPIGGEISLIVTGTIPAGAVVGTTEQYIVHGRILEGNNVVDFKPTSYTIKAPANVEIVKSIGETGVEGTFVYVFKINNTSDVAATNVVLTDNLSSIIAPDISTGVWFPYGATTGKSVTIAADGYEAISNDVDFSVVNGVMTLKIKNVPANQTADSLGGILHLRVRPQAGTTGGTTITNTASYTFENGAGATVSKNTNTVVYTVPVKYALTLEADMTKELLKGFLFDIPQVIENTGNVDDTFTLSVVDTTHINNPVFYLDDNGDGVRQENENTVVTETTLLQPGQTFKFFLNGRIEDTAPANMTITITGTSKGDTNVADTSVISATISAAGETVSVTSEQTLNVISGNQVVVGQTLTNNTGAADTFTLSVAETDGIFADVKFFVDDNGDGIKQANETTEITGPTASIADNGTLKFLMVATLKPTVPAGTENFRIVGQSTTVATALDWSVITLNVTQPKANVTVSKQLGETGVEGAYVYVFEIRNTGDVNGTDLVLTDNLPDTVEPDIANGVWFPFGATAGKSVTIAADGYEAISDDVDFSVVNGVMTLKVKNVPKDVTTGGILHLRVRPKSTTAEGTTVSNTASYVYNDGTQVTSPVNTETVTFVIPVTAKVNVVKSIGETGVARAFVYVFDIKNTGAGPGTEFVLTDNLPDTIEPDISTGVWIPYGATTGKSVTIAADGYEAISDDVDFSVVNGVMTLKIKNVPAGVTVGGRMNLRVKPKTTTAPGTIVTNTASFTYNNGVKIVPSENTNTVTYKIPEAKLAIEKFQAIDANKDLTPDAEYTKEGLTINPGEGIFYKLLITNSGDGAATNITITDIVAQYTGLSNGDGSLTQKGKPVWRVNEGTFNEITNVPAEGAAGNIVATIPTINPGDVVEIFYHVKVNE